VFVQLAVVQLIVQVCCETLHELHADGQLPPSLPVLGASMREASTCEPLTTQKPLLSQTRPWSQSVFLVQAYLSLAWLIVHAVRRSAMQTAVALIAHLRK
jgi:hypothetical protein